MREKPLFMKCCGCCALRSCLLVWAFLRMIGDALIVLFLVELPLNFWFMYKLNDPHYTHSFGEYVALISLICIVTDIIFVLILIPGVIWKKISVLKVFFFYGLAMVIVEIAWIGFLLSEMKSSHGWTGRFAFIVTVMLWMAIDISIILTLRSEITKLQNKELDNLNALNAENRTETRSIVLTGLPQWNDVEGRVI